MTEDIQTNQLSQGAGNSISDHRTFSIDQQLASQWIMQLNAWLEDRNDGCLRDLRDKLEDGRWLARWKREQTLIELRPDEIVDVVNTMTHVIQGENDGNAASVAESILTTLGQGDLCD